MSINEGQPNMSGKILGLVRSILSGWAVETRLSVAYIAIGAAWIKLSNTFIYSEDLKDFLFLLVSALALYLFIRMGVKKIRASEEALRSSQNNLARILETTASGIVVINRNESLAYANRSAEKMIGIEGARAVGRKYGDLGISITTLDGAPFAHEQRPFVRVLETGEPVRDVEVAVRRPDGVRIPLSVNAAPLRDASGEVSVVLSVEDITERERSRDMVLRKLTMAVEQSQVAVAITDRDGLTEYANHEFTRMTGYTAADVREARMVCPAGDSPETGAQIARAIGEGAGWTGVIRNRRKSGEPYWESATLSPIRDKDGSVTSFLWLREDVTAQRKADEALRESEERFRQMFEQNHEPVIIFRSGSPDIVDANPAALCLYGYTLDELIEGGPALFVPAEEMEEFVRLVGGIDNGHGVNVEATNHVRKDGRHIIVSIRGNRMKFSGGSVSYCTFRDITERVHLEEEAKVRQAQLIHTNRIASLGMLVSGVAHEVNNPNNLVMFNAPIVKGAWQDAARVLDGIAEKEGDFLIGGLSYSEMRKALPRLLDGMTDASRRIKAIVDNLKDFAAQDRSSLDTIVDLNKVAHVASSILQPEITRHTDRFESAFEEHLPPVRGCSQQLEQVVLNVVMNALQSVTGRDRKVRMSTGVNAETGWAEIRVEDEGVGIPAEAVRRIGEPFYTTKSDSGGLGLGLSICNSIVKAHKGKMTFRSDVGKGTTVTIALPPDTASVNVEPEILSASGTVS